MTRSKWAVLGLSALALAALSAFAAGGAQADGAAGEFTCLENHTTHVACTVTGVEAKLHRTHNKEQQTKHSFEAGLAKVECEETIFHGEDGNGTDPTPTITPTYSKCNAGGLITHVNMNGCHYEFHPEHTSTETKEEDEYTGTVDLRCEPEKTVTIEVTKVSGAQKCHIELHEQEDIGPIYFRTMTGADPTDVTVEALTAEAQATFHTKGPGTLLQECGVTKTNAPTFYTGNTTVTAKSKATGNPIDLALD